jgi:hypothetical protein
MSAETSVIICQTTRCHTILTATVIGILTFVKLNYSQGKMFVKAVGGGGSLQMSADGVGVLAALSLRDVAWRIHISSSTPRCTRSTPLNSLLYSRGMMSFVLCCVWTLNITKLRLPVGSGIGRQFYEATSV